MTLSQLTVGENWIKICSPAYKCVKFGLKFHTVWKKMSENLGGILLTHTVYREPILHTVLHSRTAWTAQLKYLKCTKILRPRPHCGSSQRHRKPPRWWGGVVISPFSKNLGALAQPFGLRVSALVSPPQC